MKIRKILKGIVLFFILYMILFELIAFHSFYFLVPVLFFGIVYFLWEMEHRRLIYGFLYNLSILLFLAYAFVLYYRAISLQTPFIIPLMVLFVVTFVLLLATLIFGYYAIIALLFRNAFQMMKRERRTFANLLTLILAILFTGFTALLNLTNFINMPEIIVTVLNGINVMIIYLMICFINFSTISIIYNFARPIKDISYVVVLGAGLLNGEKVTPLLAGRVDRGIQVMKEQFEATGNMPKLIMSGGQGADEKVSEAQAMKTYAVSQGIPEEDILEENQSTTTYQNMMFSKTIIGERTPKDSVVGVVFVSNEYHIFRAGLFAKMVGLKANGVGSKTAGYYLPTAFIREYMAILNIHRMRHVIICGLIIFVSVVIGIFQMIN
jgi:uncharacterized SAM-binding protein YcdF (DUF218 family)